MFTRQLRPGRIFASVLVAALLVPVAAGQAAHGPGGRLDIVHPVVARNGMVATSEALASRVGVDILKAGGNAIDAAVAIGFTLAVTLPGAGMAAYTAAKAAVAALTQALAEELAAEEIWVNAVAPSIIDTPMNRAAMPNAKHAQWPKPVAIAETIAFLAAPANLATRGAIVPVYGQI